MDFYLDAKPDAFHDRLSHSVIILGVAMVIS
jgi:hypothetical protein